MTEADSSKDTAAPVACIWKLCPCNLVDAFDTVSAESDYLQIPPKFPERSEELPLPVKISANQLVWRAKRHLRVTCSCCSFSLRQCQCQLSSSETCAPIHLRPECRTRSPDTESTVHSPAVHSPAVRGEPTHSRLQSIVGSSMSWTVDRVTLAFRRHSFLAAFPSGAELGHSQFEGISSSSRVWSGGQT